MDKLEKIFNEFSVDNLTKSGLSQQTALEINKLIKQDLTEKENLQKELDKSLINKNRFSSFNVQYFKQEYINKYKEFKNFIRNKSNYINDNWNSQLTNTITLMDLGEPRYLKTDRITDIFWKIASKKYDAYFLQIESEKYKNINVIQEIDKFFFSYISKNELIILINKLQMYKTLHFRRIGYYGVVESLRLFSTNIENNELIKILNANLKMVGFYFYCLKMMCFVLSAYYNAEGMIRQSKINNADVCFVTLLFIEFIFGELNAAILILYMKENYSFADISGENINYNFSQNQRDDDQIKLVDDYDSKLDDYYEF
jgi:hypothetical protein